MGVPIAVYKGDKALQDETNGDYRVLHDKDGDVRGGMLVGFLVVWLLILFGVGAYPVFDLIL